MKRTANEHLDRCGRPIRIGDQVRVSKSLGSIFGDREYRAMFRRCAGRVFTVVGWDYTGMAWIPISRGEVLSIETRLLKVVGRNGRDRRPIHQ